MAIAAVSGMPTEASPPAKPTPIAMPSGKLCRAMANTISQTRRNCIQSGPWRPAPGCSCGTALSASSRNSAPSTSPTATMAAPARLLPRMPAPAATPGRISEKHEAAAITPAPKPSMTSSQRAEMRRMNRAGRAPAAVASAAIAEPASACPIGVPMRAPPCTTATHASPLNRATASALPPCRAARAWRGSARKSCRLRAAEFMRSRLAALARLAPCLRHACSPCPARSCLFSSPAGWSCKGIAAWGSPSFGRCLNGG